MKGKKHKPETIEKIRQARLERKRRLGYLNSPETRKKISEEHKGRPSWNKGLKGTHFSPQTEFKKGNVSHNKGKKLGFIPKMAFKKGQIPWNKDKKQLATTGVNNPNWKGGITPENHKIRTSLEIKLWQKACLERDDFTCQKTGQRGGKLHVHHINNFANFSELRTSIENGITLSKESHKEFHKKYGIKNNTKKQLEEFLSERLGVKLKVVEEII